MPSEPASARLSCTSSSGFSPRVERPTSTAPGTVRTIVAACSARRVRSTGSGPRISIWICLSAPPKPLVNTDTWRAAHARELAAQHLPQVFLAPVPLGLGHQPHVDQRLVHAGRAEGVAPPIDV